MAKKKAKLSPGLVNFAYMIILSHGMTASHNGKEGVGSSEDFSTPKSRLPRLNVECFNHRLNFNNNQLRLNWIISIAQHEKCYDGKNILGKIKEHCLQHKYRKKRNISV